MAVRRQSQGFSRGTSSFRGVTHHPSGGPPTCYPCSSPPRQQNGCDPHHLVAHPRLLHAQLQRTIVKR